MTEPVFLDNDPCYCCRESGCNDGCRCDDSNHNFFAVWGDAQVKALLEAAPELLAALEKPGGNEVGHCPDSVRIHRDGVCGLYRRCPRRHRQSEGGTMPYGMTAMEWAWRYQNRARNRVIETTDCPWCSREPGQVCTTKTGNHTYDVHVGRIERYMTQWSAHHTPDGQPL